MLHLLECGSVAAECDDLTSGGLKVLWTHYQIIGSIEIIRIDWPEMVLKAANLLGNPNLLTLSQTC
jgi:hypothetical protein